MTRQQLRNRASILTLAGLLALAACNKPAATDAAANGALPLAAGGPTSEAYAPPLSALPDAPPPQVAPIADRSASYAYLDEAYDMTDAFDQAPPDYAFDYDGVRPWAWRGRDDSAWFAEPVEGGYRYYYFRAGASQPYLVRDPQYAYGYDGGRLAAVYDAQGRALPAADVSRQADAAGRYLARAQGLYRASSQSRQRRSVVASDWASRGPVIQSQGRQLAQQQAADPDWKAYHQAHAAQDNAQWAPERQQRQVQAQHFTAWRQSNFQGPPPKPAWTGGPPADQQPHQQQTQQQQPQQPRQQHGQFDRHDGPPPNAGPPPQAAAVDAQQALHAQQQSQQDLAASRRAQAAAADQARIAAQASQRAAVHQVQAGRQADAAHLAGRQTHAPGAGPAGTPPPPHPAATATTVAPRAHVRPPHPGPPPGDKKPDEKGAQPGG